MAKKVTAEEYALWLAPAAALQQLAPLIRMVAMDAIVGRLRTGEIHTVARTFRERRRDGSTRTEEYVVVNISSGMNQIEPRFWAVGDLTMAPDNLRESGYSHLRVPGQGPTLDFHGLRFNRDDIQELRDQLGIEPPPATPPPSSARRPESPTTGAPPKVPKERLLAWVQSYAARNPGSPFGIILRNARLEFEPKFRVTERPVKKAIADLKLTLRVGNPSILQK